MRLRKNRKRWRKRRGGQLEKRVETRQGEIKMEVVEE